MSERASVFEAEDGTRWIMHVTPSDGDDPCRMMLAEYVGPGMVQGRREFTLVGSIAVEAVTA